MEQGRSAIWARLDGVEREYLRVCGERDKAIAERDVARESLRPLLEQVRALEKVILEVLPKADTRLPSRRVNPPSEEQVAGWAERNAKGEAISKIAATDGVGMETVRIALIRSGVKPVVRQKVMKSERVPRCKECRLPFDSPALTHADLPAPKDGVCGLCQFIANDLAEERAKAKEANGNGRRYQVGAAELAGAQDVLRFVQTLSDPQAEAIARQLERLVVVEMALRKLCGAVDECVLNMGRPMTLRRERWEAMRLALAEGKARLRQ